jgi:hypothetical protein
MCKTIIIYRARSLGARIRNGKMPKIITNVNLEKRRKKVQVQKHAEPIKISVIGRIFSN